MQAAPEFTLPATGGKTFDLAKLRGKYLVLYFYPKDNTPGCTVEGQQFALLHEKFTALGCEIFGFSRDSVKSHENFKAKFAFPFDLVSDQEETACKRFDVIKDKKLYGKPVRGIERSTFLIDREGRLLKEWRGVKADGHAHAVLEYLASL